MNGEKTKSQTDIEWEQRILCLDESCIGVIGPDGRCKECNRPYDGDLPEPPPAIPAAEDEDASPAVAPDTAYEDHAPAADAGEDDPGDEAVNDAEWEQRTLCRDESCIGVIGPDGRCTDCGKSSA